MRQFILALFLSIGSLVAAAQETYTIGRTEYYYNQYYSTTGQPMVKRSDASRAEFLRDRGYQSVPYGYEVDHIIPLSEGGTDDPSNMQLLTIAEHDRKTALERARNSNSTYRSPSNYHFTSTPAPSFSAPSSTDSQNRTIHTGERGGQYYINSSGNKTYVPSSTNGGSFSTPSYNGGGRTIQTGPRGGQYYINSNGNKTYIKKH